MGSAQALSVQAIFLLELNYSRKFIFAWITFPHLATAHHTFSKESGGEEQCEGDELCVSVCT